MECKGNVTAVVTINMPRAEGLPPDRPRFSKPQVSHHHRFDHKKALAIGLHLVLQLYFCDRGTQVVDCKVRGVPSDRFFSSQMIDSTSRIAQIQL
jgi:hypothetical protein